MPDRHVLETQEISVVALLRQGEPKSTDVEFKFKQDGKAIPEKPEYKVKLLGDEWSSEGKAAACKLVAPVVPADKPKSLIEYSVTHEKRVLSPAEQIFVWPKSGKLKAFEPDGKTPLARFAFKVKQGTKESAALRANDAGEAEFQLAPGLDFTIVAAAPFEIQSTDTKKLRELVIKAERKFTATFALPAVPDTGNIKQWVNQASVSDGQTGFGKTVVVKLAANEDLLNPKADRIAGPGVFAYLTAIFSGPGGKHSPRVDPAAKRELVAGKQITDVVEDPVIKGKFTAKVELKLDGSGSFELTLGKAGGDTCTISIGATKGRTDSTLVFENWRKVYYVIHAPSNSPLPTRSLTGTGGLSEKHRDFPPETLSHLTTLNASSWVEMELLSGKPFPITAQHKADLQVLPGSFRDRPGELFQLSDAQSMATLRSFPKPVGKAPLMRFILCDMNMYCDGGAPASASEVGEGLEITVPLAGGYWLPRSALDNTPGLKELKWIASIVANPQPVAITWAPNVSGDNGGTDKKRVLKVRETVSGATVTLSWDKPTTAHVPTEVTSGQKTSLSAFVRPLVITLAARRELKNKLRFEITSVTGNTRQTARIDNVKAAVEDAVNGLALPRFDPHPGLDDAGLPRTGPLACDTVVVMAKSKRHAPVIKLPDAAPDDPGKLVGPLSDTRCPIVISFKHDKHGSGLGCAYGNNPSDADLKGDMLIVFHAGGKLCAADTIVHEAGHLFGLTPFGEAAGKVGPGVPEAKSSTATEVDAFRFNGTKGHLYDGHGGSGPHCCYGLSDAQKLDADYSEHTAAAKCVMFGNSPGADSGRAATALCPQCALLLRAKDYSTYL